jgi:penicillin amidase
MGWRVVGWGLFAVVAACSLIVANRLLAVPDRAPAASGTLESLGLRADVRVVRDPLGVPHVEAETESDAWFGLGLAHAQDRLWQMELQRRAARGKLSELFGVATLPADRLARTLGLGLAADREAAGLTRRTARLLEAYAAGVNRWLEEIEAGRAALPVEFTRLAIEPEPWRPADSLALVRLRAWMLSRSLGSSLLLDRLVREIGGVASQQFFPEESKHPRDDLARRGLRRAADLWAASVGLRGRVGSGGFVVGAGSSQSGLPILANDPHVELGIPAVFYVAHVRSRDWEAGGATWPGIPVFWTGTNRTIAWGQVALFASSSELYEETLQPSDPTRYDWGGAWRRAERRVEPIAVRDAAEQEIEVLSTRHGPLLGSVDPEDVALFGRALRWTGSGPRSGIESALGVQRARSWRQFRAALRELPAPAASFLYADVEGNAGTQVAGQLPIRSIQTALLPVPGRSAHYDWRGFIPFDALPRRYGRDLAYAIASPHPSSGAFPHPVAWLWHDRDTERRMRRRLEQGAPFSLRGVVELQRERVSSRGPERVRVWLAEVAPRSDGARRLHRLLLAWDGSTDVESTGAAAYHVFRANLIRRLLRERVAPELAEALGEVAEPIPGALVERFLERVDRDVARGLAAEVLEETWSWFSLTLSSNPTRWTWGELHRLRLDHAFERFGAGTLGWAGSSFGVGPVAAPGGPESVWAMYSTPEAPFDVRVGPGVRFAVDMRDSGHPWIGLAGGQSGHPGSPHYADALDDWLAGEPRPLWLHASDVAYHEAGVWTLRPASP